MANKLFNKLFPKKKETISFRASMDLAGLPVVTFAQGKNKFNFLLDTGSSLSIINKRILKNIEHTPYDNTVKLMGMDGINHEAKTCVIDLTFKDKHYVYPFLIQDMSKTFAAIKKDSGVTVHGLLGSSFFNEFKYVLDFDELIAYSKQ